VQRTLLPRIVFATLASAGVLLDVPATAATFKCEVKVNGRVILAVRATDRDNCYWQTSFGSENCAHYAPYLKPGVNLLEQIFNSTDRVNSEYCKELSAAGFPARPSTRSKRALRETAGVLEQPVRPARVEDAGA
jgi:hypothetical protein